jgi:hypothetical protein
VPIFTARRVPLHDVSSSAAAQSYADAPPQVTKTVADKLLKEMEQSNQIMGKATNGDKKGSQWVFWALQVCLPPVAPRTSLTATHRTLVMPPRPRSS